MEQDDPIAHRLNFTSQTSTSGRCKANLAKLKEDLAGHNEVKLSDLSSVRQGQNESVLDFFQRFKAIKNRCFNLTIFEKDLANLAYNGLRSYLKEKLNGFDFISVNHLQMNLNLRMQKILSKLISPCMLIVNLIRTMRKRKLLSLYGHQKLSHTLVHRLSRFQRIGKNKLVLLLMFLSVIVYLTNCLEAETTSCLMSYRCLRS